MKFYLPYIYAARWAFAWRRAAQNVVFYTLKTTPRSADGAVKERAPPRVESRKI